MNAQPSVQVQVGYPEFWSVVLQKHERFFAQTQTIGTTIDEMFGVGMSESMHKICRHLAKMVSNSLNAVLLLGMNGFGIDALKIARTMLEGAVNIAYLRQHPEEFDDYYDFHLVVAMKRQQYMELYSPQSLSRLTPELIAETKREYDRVAPRFTDRKGNPRSRWSNKAFYAICAELGIKEHYLTFYDLASHIIHADMSGVMAQADPEPGVLDVDMSPSEKFVGMALRTAHFAFVLAASEYIAMARPEKQAIVDHLNNDFVTAWGKDGA